jgi:hypothetical protein
MPIPKPAIHEITDRLNALMDEERPSQLALAQLRTEAKKLIRSDHAAMGYAALGMIGTLAFDSDAVVSAFQNSLRLQYDPVTAENFAISLDRVGKLKLAADIAAETARRHPDSIGAIDTALRQALFVFRLKDAAEFMERLKKLRTGLTESRHRIKAFAPDRDHVDFRDFSDFIIRAEAAGVMQGDLAERAEAAAAILFEQRVVARGTEFGFVPGGGVAYMFSVRRSVDEAVELSWGMAERIVSRFKVSLSEWATFSAVTKEEVAETS